MEFGGAFLLLRFRIGCHLLLLGQLGVRIQLIVNLTTQLLLNRRRGRSPLISKQFNTDDDSDAAASFLPPIIQHHFFMVATALGLLLVGDSVPI